MEHVVEAYDAVAMQDRSDQFQIVGQAFARMVAVDVNEADGPPAEPLAQFSRSDLAAVGLPGQVAITRNAVGGAIGKKTTFNAGIGPIEAVNAQGHFAGRKAERHGDEKAALESPDFDQVTANAEGRLPADKVPADSRREAGGHAAHPLVALREVEVDSGMTARDVKHQTRLLP